jgi:hypothetical protein
MKRLHVHVSVPDLGQSIRFYLALFGLRPSVDKDALFHIDGEAHDRQGL